MRCGTVPWDHQCNDEMRIGDDERCGNGDNEISVVVTMAGAVLTMMMVSMIIIMRCRLLIGCQPLNSASHWLIMTMMFVSMATGDIQHTALTSGDIETILTRGDDSDMIKVDGDCVLTPRNFTSSGKVTLTKVTIFMLCSQEAAVCGR